MNDKRQYYITKSNNSQEGPYDHDAFLSRCKAGKYDDQTVVWYEGLNEWVNLGLVYDKKTSQLTDLSDEERMAPQAIPLREDGSINSALKPKKQLNHLDENDTIPRPAPPSTQMFAGRETDEIDAVLRGANIHKAIDAMKAHIKPKEETPYDLSDLPTAGAELDDEVPVDPPV